jgi:diacylglycerol kinase family enzyme
MTPDLATRPIVVILNSGSGNDDKSASAGAIGAALDAAGRRFRIDVAREPAEIERFARAAAADPVPAIVVGAGGDGTINTVAGAVLGTAHAFGLVPMGTFNYFARDLGISEDPGTAAASLATGTLRRVHVARVNGHLFLNNATFGLYRQLLEEREQLQERLGRYRVVAALSALRTVWRHRRVYDVELALDGRSERLRTPMLFFGLNSLQLEQLDLDVARATDAGLMAVIALRPMSPLAIVGLALRGALQGLRGSGNLRCHGASRVTVRWRGARHTRVAVDGEVFDCTLPLEFGVEREALPVVVPRRPEERR